MKNVVQDLTSAGIDWQREKWQSGLGSKFIHQGEKNAAKYADEVIVLSKGVQDYFKETYGRETHFIPNGVNRPQIREASLITDKFGQKKDSYILFLGRLVPEKGIRYLVEAFKNVKTDKKLVIAGGSSDTDSFMEELKDLAKGDDRILFTGFVQGAMLDELYSNPEYKIVEAHNGALGVYALHAAKVSKIPVRIFHAHGASITKDWKLPIKLVCKACLPTNMTHHFSCGVEAAKCYFGQKVVDENDYVLIPNAIDVERFIYNPKIRNKIRKENDLENKHVVGHVGRFMAQKNHTFLVDVFAEVLKIDSQAHLVLLGDGELMDEIKRKAADLGISEHVTFVGNVGNANEWYQAFDCFVLPSIWEGLPVVGVEAQAADLPCVFSSAITREIGLSQRAKFVPLTESVSVWAKTLCDALQQNERNDNTKLITEHHYNIAFEAKKLQERYLQLAGEVK